MIQFRQLHDTASGAFSYLLADAASGEALIIDSVLEHITLYLGLIDELRSRLAYVLETHVHEDHASAGALLRASCGAKVVYSRASGVRWADLLVSDGDAVALGQERICVRATPGHTQGCVSYLWRDRLFSGDALLIGGCGRTDLPDSNAGQLYDSLTRRILTLPDETLVYPGRDGGGRRVTCIGEEREHNPSVTGRTRDEFVAGMARLNPGRASRSESSLPRPGIRLVARAATHFSRGSLPSR